MMPDAIEVTYTGGYVERTANPDAPNRLPACIQRDIALAAQALGQTATTSGYPVGAESVRLGDAAVTFGEGGAPARSDLVDGCWSRETLRYRRRLAWGV